MFALSPTDYHTLSLCPLHICLSSPRSTLSALLLSYGITSSFSLTHSDSPLTSLGASVCPSKACPDFLLSAYFFGSNLLFYCPKLLLSHLTSISAQFWAALAVWKAIQSREAVQVFFSNFKVVLTRMLCLINSKVVAHLCSVTCTMQNGKKIYLKFCEIIMKWKKGLPGAEWHFKHLV